MARKSPEPHIYDDVDITSARLNKFAIAPRAEQVAALAKLRAQSADDSAAIKLNFSSLLIAILLVIAAPLIVLHPAPALRASWIATLIVTLILVAVLLVALSPAMWDTVRDQSRRERATVWLGAYEDELARRHRLRGAAARRWQRDH